MWWCILIPPDIWIFTVNLSVYLCCQTFLFFSNRKSNLNCYHIRPATSGTIFQCFVLVLRNNRDIIKLFLPLHQTIRFLAELGFEIVLDFPWIGDQEFILATSIFSWVLNHPTLTLKQGGSLTTLFHSSLNSQTKPWNISFLSLKIL
jgi:hypothetical protein